MTGPTRLITRTLYDYQATLTPTAPVQSASWNWGDNAFVNPGMAPQRMARKPGGFTATVSIESSPWGTLSRSFATTVYGSVITGGLTYGCAILQAGSVHCWGSDLQGQLGNGPANDGATSLTPVVVSGLTDARSVEAGSESNCALRNSGAVACWGRNQSGQLGVGDQANRNVPTAVPGLTDATQVSVGHDHACALKQDRSVVCWGNNVTGETGSPQNPSLVLSPLPVPGVANAVAITTGNHTSCALIAGGSVQCWGWNTWGQFGLGHTQASVPVTTLPLTEVTDVRLSAFGLCALKADHTVWCSGKNDNGTVGDGSFNDTSSFRQVVGLANARQLSAAPAGGTVCALRATQDTVCWGTGDRGQLGNGGTANSSVPVVATGSAHAAQVAAGATGQLILRADGSLWASGAPHMRGDGNTADALTPVAVAGGAVYWRGN